MWRDWPEFSNSSAFPEHDNAFPRLYSIEEGGRIMDQILKVDLGHVFIILVRACVDAPVKG